MLDTRQLRLRRLGAADETRFVALDSDPEVMRYIGSRGGTPEEIVARVRDRIAADHGALGWWVIEGRDDGAFHGVAALLRMPDGDDIELAYRLAMNESPKIQGILRSFERDSELRQFECGPEAARGKRISGKR